MEAQNSKKSIYYGLDVGKFICAFLIVYLHAYCRDGGSVGHWIHSVITPVGVPFFFITPGFFFGKGLLVNDPLAYTKKYSLRILKMYVFWSIICLPVAQICILARYPDASFAFQLAYNLRLFFLTGSIGIYWYLLSLILCSWIIYWAKTRNKEHIIFFLAICLFVIGAIYDSPYSKGTLWAQAIHVIWGSERNFLNVGLIYMLIGYFIGTKPLKRYTMLYAFGLAVAIVLKHWEVQNLSIHLFQLPMAVFLFLLFASSEMKWASSCSLRLRKYSTALYLTHYPVLLLWDFYLRRGTIINISFILAVTILCYFIVQQLPTKWQKVIYG